MSQACYWQVWWDVLYNPRCKITHANSDLMMIFDSRRPVTVCVQYISVRLWLILVKYSTYTLAAMLDFFTLVGNQFESLLGSGACNDYIRGVWQKVWAGRLSLSEGSLRDMNNWCAEVEAERRGLKAERLLQCHPLWRVKVPHMEKWLLCWSVYCSCC